MDDNERQAETMETLILVTGAIAVLSLAAAAAFVVWIALSAFEVPKLLLRETFDPKIEPGQEEPTLLQ